MAFVNSWFFWALLALAIPIIIHLFNFRRYKKVYFTNVKFLKEIKEEQNARRKLRNLLVLLSRLLALAFLIAGFAQPFLDQGKEIDLSAKNVGIFIDNSFSMNAVDEDIPLLDVAKEQARVIVQNHDDQDLFHLLTHDFLGRHQRLLSKEDMLSEIDEIKTTPKVSQLSTAISRNKQINSINDRSGKLYILSDFQESINDLASYRDTSLDIQLLPLQAVAEKNISIDTAYFLAKVPMLNVANKLIVKLTNYSTEDVENVSLSITQDGQTKPSGKFDMTAASQYTDTISVTIQTPGIQNLELKVTDYPISFDDRYFMSFDVDDKIEVLVVHDSNTDRYLKAAINGLDYHELTASSTRNIDYNSFDNYDLIILQDIKKYSSGLIQSIDQYVNKGGNILHFLPEGMDIVSCNQLFQTMKMDQVKSFSSDPKGVSYINEEDFTFNEVFLRSGGNRKLPKVSSSYIMTQYQSNASQPIMKHRDGSAFMSKYNAGEGQYYLCTSPIDKDKNDLVANAEVFIPLIYKLSISTQSANALAYFIGQNDFIKIKGSETPGDQNYVVKGNQEFIPAVRNIDNRTVLNFNEQVTESGFYDIYLGEEKLQSVAYNYDRKESNMSMSSNSDLEYNNPSISTLQAANNTKLAQLVSQRDKGQQLWKWCLILALVFLGIETLLLRFWKS